MATTTRWRQTCSDSTPVFCCFSSWRSTATACGSTESPGAEGGSEGNTKTITHEYGETEVPTDLERVAVLHTATRWCSGSALDEVGLVRPPDQRGADTINDLSVELLPRLDADLLLYFVGSTATPLDEARQAAAAITSNPLWDTLDVVQSGQAYQVDTAH